MADKRVQQAVDLLRPQPGPEQSATFDITQPGVATPSEPQPGTPEFGARALSRIADIQRPAPGDEPTPEELAKAREDQPAVDPDPIAGAASMGSLPSVALPPASTVPDDSNELLKQILADKTPIDESDPEGDIIHRLSTALLGPPDKIPEARPFTAGEHLALGIIGALDKDAFTHVVMPLLAQEANAPRQAALDREQQSMKRITALETLSRVMEAKRAHEESMGIRRETRITALLQMKQQREEFNARQTQEMEIARMKEGDRNKSAGKIPDRAMGDYTLAVIANSYMQKALSLIDKDISESGGAPGGPISGHLGGFGPGGDARSKLDAMFSAANEAQMQLFKRRSIGSGAALAKIGGAYPTITDVTATKRNRTLAVMRTAAEYATALEAAHPELRAVRNQILSSAADPDAAMKIIDDADLFTSQLAPAPVQVGYQNGDQHYSSPKSRGLWIPDSEVRTH